MFGDWVESVVCPVCKAEPALGEGFERVFENASESDFGRDVVQVQCENCGRYFGTIDVDTNEVLELGEGVLR